MSGSPQTLELRIDSLAAGGDGVGRAADGRVVFVPFTAPGDRARVAVEPGGARFARGRVVELLEPATSRTDPVCAVFGSCGGCVWQHVARDAQLEARRTILRDAIERIGGIRLDAPPEIVACPSPYAYRSRTRVVVEAGRVGYRRRRSRAVCATSRCPVLVAPLEEALRALASRPPMDDGEWEIAAGDDGNVCTTRLGARERAPGRLVIHAAGERIERSAGVFAQSNALLLDPLARAVLEAAGSGERAVELFSGAGFFTIGLARRFEHVVAVEGDPIAASDLENNVGNAGLSQVEIVRTAVEHALGLPALARAAPDVVVLDPPRTGLPRGLAPAIGALDAARIVYLSCDPATLARDVSTLVPLGYDLVSVRGFDLFPQTAHVEALVVLERRLRA